MNSIFLSYARSDDEPFVKRLYEALFVRGFDVWFDRASMPSRNLTFHQEIRDAVAVCDRLVLIVGPKAAESLYVRQEWQFAYFEAEKIVTPILRCGDYSTVPDELKLLHCEDFRDDVQYDFHLKNLLRQLAEPAPALGKLIGVPSLPAHFLSRTDRLTALRDALRADLDRPIVISGASARVGMHGMGGIGKSVLAATLSRDRKIREAFPDGIVWVGLGQSPTVADLQRRVHKDLGGDGAFQTEHEGRVKLRDILKDKTVLLILDDVWCHADVDWFDVLGPRCRAMITTRDAGLLTSLGGVHHQVELLTDAEALNLLAQAASVEPYKLPGEAADLIAECGRLPLAVALCGCLIRHGFEWAKLLEQLRTSRIDRIKDPHAVKVEHENIWNAIDVSVKFLSADEQARFLELAVFPSDEATPIAALRTLWLHTAGCDDWDSAALIIKLSQRSLLELTLSAAGKAISLHDLVHDYVHRAAGDEAALHRRLLEAYRRKCPDGWHVDPPNDGYFLTHLRHHLIAADRADELADLLQELRWLEAKNAAGLVFDLGEDYNLALRQSLGGFALRPWDSFVRQQAAVLNAYPELLLQQAANEPVDSPVSCAARNRLEAPGEPRHWLERVNRPQRFVPSACTRVMVGHDEAVFGVDLTDDGTVAVSAGGDDTVRVWDLRTGKPGSILKGHKQKVWSVAVSADGSTAISGDMSGTICVWDLGSGARTHVLEGHKGIVPVAITADGIIAVSGGEDQAIRVWDLQTGECLFVLDGHAHGVHGVAVSADGRMAFSGGEDRAVRVWDLPQRSCRYVLGGHSGPVRSVGLSPDGRVGLSADTDSRILMWDLDTGECRGVLEGHSNWIWGVAVAADGQTAVSCASDETVRIWDLATKSCRAVLYGHSVRVHSIAVVPDGSVAVSASEDGALRVWDLRLAASVPAIEGHTRRVSSVAIATDGKWAVSASIDGTLRVWETETGECQAVMRGHIGSVLDVEVLQDGLTAVSAGDRTLRLWNLRTGRCHAVLEGHTDDVTCLALTADGQTLVSGSRDQTVRVWDLQALVCRMVLRGHEEPPTEQFCKSLPGEFTSDSGERWVHSIMVTTDGRTAVSVALDRRMRVWDLTTGACQGEYFEGFGAGKRITSSLPLIVRGQSEYHRIVRETHSWVLRSAPDGVPLGRFPCSRFSPAALSADGQSVITADGREVYLLRLRRRDS